MARDLEKRKAYQREYQRKWSRKKRKGIEEISRNEFDKYMYKVVPNTWRELVQTRERYETPEISSPLVLDMIKGKTVFVDYTVPHGANNNHPFRTLYSYFNTRGYRLRVHVFDVVDKEEYRKLLMWAEPVKPVKQTKIA